MTDEQDGSDPQRGTPVKLQTLTGGGAPPSDPRVRLLREFKGLTVGDLVRDGQLVEQLPGRVRSAAEHLGRGELAPAEQALPGSFGPVRQTSAGPTSAGPNSSGQTTSGAVLEGPGHRRRQPVPWAAWVLLGAVAIAALAVYSLTRG
jgi:hypothetical protein